MTTWVAPHTTNTAIREIDDDHGAGIVAANATAALYAAQLDHVRRLKTDKGRRNMMRDLYDRNSDARNGRSYMTLGEQLTETADDLTKWADGPEFERDRRIMELIGLEDDAIEAYRREVLDIAESVRRYAKRCR